MILNLKKLLDRHARLFMDGDTEEITCDFAAPLLVQVGSNAMVFSTHEKLAVGLAAHRAAYAELGLTGMNWNILATELPQNGRFRVWVDWHPLGIPCGTGNAQLIYFCRTTSSLPKIEMVQYTRFIVEKTRNYRPELQRSA